MIAARPVSSLADIVDRAILAAWWCDTLDGQLIGEDGDPGGFQPALILGVLALAGIHPAQCIL
jgi:hypothetical protein